ncbi:hypothetical protein QOL99_17755, partial [Deinococcus sp. MIMF12]
GEWQRTQPFALPPHLRWLAGGLPDPRLLPPYARADHDLLHLLALAGHNRVRGGEETWLLEGTHPLTEPLLARLLGSGRLHWGGGQAPLAPGPDLSTALSWDLDAGGV